MLRKEFFYLNDNKIRRMATNSMLAALCAVLGFVSIDLGNFKFTLESFPITMGALLFGPVDGMVIAFIGNFISQLLKYGLSATTLVWIAPYVAAALVVGLYAKAKDFKLTPTQTVFITLLAEIIITVLNTGAMYIDSKFYGYYSFAYIFGATIPRVVVCVVKGIIYGVVMPHLLKAIRKTLKPET